MFSITHFQQTPPEAIKSQILQLVIDYLTDISMVAIPPSNPLYNLYQYGVGHEVHQYLDAMGGGRELSVELVVALGEQEQVLGFALYLPVQGEPQACSVAYMAVRASQRRKGIARAMLAKVREACPQVELSCFVNRVPYFEAMGFQVLGARGPQVLMSTQDHFSDGLVAVLDIAPIYSSLEVRQIHAYLLNQHGKRAMQDAEKKRDRQLDLLARQAHAFVQLRFGEAAARNTGRGQRLV